MTIVHLHDFGNNQRGLPAQDARQVIESCRVLAKKHLDAAVKLMMAGIDDALFELAEKAESDAAQNHYFDAMREVRIKRSDMEASFLQALESGMEQALKSGGSDDSMLHSQQELSLLAEDKLEEDLAVRNMVDKVRFTAKQDLALLERRCGFLLGDPELTQHELLVSPTLICKAFLVACEYIESGLKVKLIILKLFDRFVVSEGLPELYRGLNRQLIEQGVLPELKLNERINKTRATSRKREKEPTEESDVDEGWEKLQQLLAEKTIDGGNTSVGRGSSSSGILSEMLGNLTRIQQGDTAAVIEGLAGVDSATSATGSVNIIRDVKAHALAAGVSGFDAMIIDVVEMLFDYILSDKNIPDAMRSLIGRLQIPVLKVAILDRDFFTRKSHPARMFLNRLAEQAVVWNQAGDDGLYAKCTAVVERVLAEFDQDIGLFEDALAELEDYLEQESNRAEVEEEKSTRLVQGKERLQLARQVADREIRRRTGSEGLPLFVNQFLEQYWQNLLLVRFMVDGEESILWQQALATMDNLVWSVRPKAASERERLVKLLPGLLASLRAGASAISMRETVFQQFLGQLADCHAMIVNRSVEEAGKVVLDNPALKQIPELEQDDSLTVATLSRMIEEQDLQGVEVEEITLSQNDEAAEDDGDEHSEQVAGLGVGDWIEIENESGNKTRAKLTWISSVSGNYLFTDRNGHKAAELTGAGLAACFRRGTAHLINDVPLFDRAVSSLIGGLKGQSAGF